MSDNWNDINSSVYTGIKKQEPGETKLITGVEDSGPAQDEKPEPLVRILSAEWKPGPKGFKYNETCFLDVKTEMLKKTVRSRIQGKLFGIFNGEEVDILQNVEGFIDKGNGIARLTKKNLWYVNNSHYNAWVKDKTVQAKYIIKEISHSRGENTIDSPPLKMPQTMKLIRLVFNDDFNDPLANVEYTFEVGDEIIVKGSTDNGGKVEFAAPDSAKKGILTILGERISILIEEIMPSIGKIDGIQMRLKNIGFDTGPVDGIFGPRTWRAIHDFQKKTGLKPTLDELDDDTRQKLSEYWDKDNPVAEPEEKLSYSC